MFANPSRDQLQTLCCGLRTVAIVGLSPNPARPSHGVARALQRLGLRIVPVRPALTNVLGEPAWPSLSAIPEDLRRQIDVVDVFRNADQVAPLVDECIALGLPAIWLQDGVIDEVAAQRGREAGLTVVMDRCLWRDYIALTS